MNLASMSVLYLLVGSACAIAIWRRGERNRPLHAALAIPLWPLWAPVALSDPSPREASSVGNVSARVEEALREGVEIAAGSALQAMLNEHSAARITTLAHRAEARRAELAQLLARPDFDLEAARQRVDESPQHGTPRALSTARLHLSNIERLQRMAARDDALLQELLDLAETLRTQLLMVRFSGSCDEGIGDIVNDLFGRIEALSEAMDDQPQPTGTQHGEPPHPGRG